MISEMHNPYIFVSAMCNFKMKLHFLFITKLSLSVCWNVVLLSLPSALSGDFSGNSLMYSRIIAQFCFLFQPLSFACAAGDPCEMFIILDTVVFQVYLPLRSLTCPLIQKNEEVLPSPHPWCRYLELIGTDTCLQFPVPGWAQHVVLQVAERDCVSMFGVSGWEPEVLLPEKSFKHLLKQ